MARIPKCFRQVSLTPISPAWVMLGAMQLIGNSMHAAILTPFPAPMSNGKISRPTCLRPSAYEQMLDLFTVPVCGIGAHAQLRFANRAAKALFAESRWL